MECPDRLARCRSKGNVIASSTIGDTVIFLRLADPEHRLTVPTITMADDTFAWDIDVMHSLVSQHTQHAIIELSCSLQIAYSN